MPSHSKSKKINRYAEPDRFKNMTGTDIAAGITLLFIAAVIPLIVKYALVPTGADEKSFITASDTTIDMFSYYKSIFILISSCVLLICLSAYTFEKRLKPLFKWRDLFTNPFSLGFWVFIVAIIASSIGSGYKYTVVHGISERYESVFILLCYFVIFAAAVLFVRSAFQCGLLIYGLLFSCFIIGLIAAFQFLKMDFFMTKFANALVLGINAKMKLTTQFPDQSYSTLFNPDSLGSYAALMLPITVIGAIYCNRGRVMRILFIACAILTAITVIGCNSSGSLAGATAGAAAAFITFICLAVRHNVKIIRNKIFIGIAAVLCVAAVIVSVAPIRSRLYTMTMKLAGLNAVNASIIKDLSINGNQAVISTVSGNIYFTKTQDELQVSSDGIAPLTPFSTENTQSPSIRTQDTSQTSVSYNYSVPGLGDFNVEVGQTWFLFRMYGVTFAFGLYQNNNIVALNNVMQPVDINEPIPSWGFKGMEMWGSGRGYIWSRSFPLLLRNPVLGSGPDTFILEFPQNDIVGKAKYFGSPWIVVDKAHNLFLQTGINTGIISSLALIFIFIWYIVTSFFSVIKGASAKEDKWLFGMRIGILAGVCGYAVASAATDSTVSVSPVFWMILGIGVALQRRLARE